MEHAVTAERSRTRMLVMAALFAALGYAATAALMVPSPTGGYLNLGDAVVLLGAYLLGPAWGALAGGIGPAMADLLSGYMMWVPGTLAVKAAMAALAAALYRALGKRPWALFLAGAAAEAVMVAGYWLYDGLVITGSLAGGAAGIPGNLVQGAFGLAASTLLALALRRSGFVRREFPNL